jgi:hypothetical protein
VTSASEPAALIRLADTGAEAVERIRHRLADIVESPDDFSSLDSEETRSLLIFLANHGLLLRNAIVTDFLGEDLAASKSIQLASMVPDAYLPVEFAYDFPAPDTSARLCIRAGDTLRSVDPLAPCPGMHDEMVVCPLGFWGLTKVIERYTFQKRDDLSDGFLARAQPVGERNRITWNGGVLVASSQRIDAHDHETSARLRAGLEARVHPAYFVETWAAWDERVSRSQPSILLMLPHTIYSDELGLPGLEIGQSDRRLVSAFHNKTMIPETPVVAMLLGCETAVAGAVSYERFPANLRTAGAEIIVTTLTEVLGRQAAPLAERMVTLMLEGTNQPARFGETMVRLRRQLLAEGLPMVLAIAVYGDADWLVGGR